MNYTYDDRGVGTPETVAVGDFNLPMHMGVIGQVFGIPVVESPALAYDEMFISTERSKIVVGELAHFKYRMKQLDLNRKCRRKVRADIETAARRILGEPWEVSSN